MMQKHKLLAFGIALFCSICLWFYAVTVVNPDDTKTISNIRVRLDGTDILTARGLMLTGGEDLRVSVKLRGRRSDLKELNKDTVVAVASLGRVTEAGDTVLSWTLELPPTVAAGDISVEERSEATVTVPVSQVRELTDMDISVLFDVTTANGYWTALSQLSLDTRSVTVRGPATEVDRIEQAVVRLSQTGISEKIDSEFPIYYTDEDGNALTLSSYCTISADAVHVTLPVYHSKQLQLAYRITDGCGVTAADVKFTSSLPSITVTGTPETLAKLDSVLYVGRIDLATFNGGTLATPDADGLEKLLPDDVTVRNDPQSITTLAVLSGIVIHQFEIPAESVLRLDTMTELRLAEGAVIIVSIRGRSEMIQKLKVENLVVTADLARDLNSLTNTVTVDVRLPEDNTAGVWGGPYEFPVVAVDPQDVDEP